MIKLICFISYWCQRDFKGPVLGGYMQQTFLNLLFFFSLVQNKTLINNFHSVIRITPLCTGTFYWPISMNFIRHYTIVTAVMVGGRIRTDLGLHKQSWSYSFNKFDFFLGSNLGTYHNPFFKLQKKSKPQN